MWNELHCTLRNVDTYPVGCVRGTAAVQWTKQTAHIRGLSEATKKLQDTMETRLNNYFHRCVDNICEGDLKQNRY